MTDADKIANAKTALAKPFTSGSRVTNCVAHAGAPLTGRSTDCPLCMADVKNQLTFAIQVNEFLNEKVEAAQAALV